LGIYLLVNKERSREREKREKRGVDRERDIWGREREKDV
jgi:hypothetical protein